MISVQKDHKFGTSPATAENPHYAQNSHGQGMTIKIQIDFCYNKFKI